MSFGSIAPYIDLSAVTTDSGIQVRKTWRMELDPGEIFSDSGKDTELFITHYDADQGLSIETSAGLTKLRSQRDILKVFSSRKQFITVEADERYFSSLLSLLDPSTKYSLATYGEASLPLDTTIRTLGPTCFSIRRGTKYTLVSNWYRFFQSGYPLGEPSIDSVRRNVGKLLLEMHTLGLPFSGMTTTGAYARHHLRNRYPSISVETRLAYQTLGLAISDPSGKYSQYLTLLKNAQGRAHFISNVIGRLSGYSQWDKKSNYLNEFRFIPSTWHCALGYAGKHPSEEAVAGVYHILANIPSKFKRLAPLPSVSQDPNRPNESGKIMIWKVGEIEKYCMKEELLLLQKYHIPFKVIEGLEWIPFRERYFPYQKAMDDIAVLVEKCKVFSPKLLYATFGGSTTSLFVNLIKGQLDPAFTPSSVYNPLAFNSLIARTNTSIMDVLLSTGCLGGQSSDAIYIPKGIDPNNINQEFLGQSYRPDYVLKATDSDKTPIVKITPTFTISIGDDDKGRDLLSNMEQYPEDTTVLRDCASHKDPLGTHSCPLSLMDKLTSTKRIILSKGFSPFSPNGGERVELTNRLTLRTRIEADEFTENGRYAKLQQYIPALGELSRRGEGSTYE